MKQYSYQELVHIIETLRSENGCAWDREQTHESMIPHLAEESYEVIEAIKQGDQSNLKEELGDLLMQVLMHAQIAKENKSFTLEDIISGIAEKLVYRHPHVFGEEKLGTSEEVLKRWEELKLEEKNQQTVTQSMEHIAKALPALMRAYKIQKKAAQVGFIWDAYEPIIAKVLEGLEGVKNEVKLGNKAQLNQEIGDLLFSIVNLSYFFEINPEFALTNSTEKFINRFRYIENWAFAEQKQLSQMTLEEMDSLWNKCKKVELNI